MAFYKSQQGRWWRMAAGTITGLLLGAAATAQQNQAADFPVAALTARPAQVAGVSQPVTLLNGAWQLRVGANASGRPVQVPGEWEMQGFHVAEGDTAFYSRTFTIADDWRQGRVKLRFEAISTHGIVWVNGKQVAIHEGGFVPFEADITDALKPGINTLDVGVQAQTISDRLACTSQYAVHTVGGILRNVEMFVVPATHITTLTPVTTFDNAYHNAVLQLATTLAGPAESGRVLEYELRNAQGHLVLQQRTPVTGETIKTNLRVQKPEQWSAEHPYLYSLATRLVKNGKVIEALQQKVGFRQVTVNGNRLLVNGKPVRLHGVNRHSIYPLTGRSITAELDIADVALLRAGNCNYIRTSHYPPSEAFLNACDSLGMFVESESALCWIQHGASPIWQDWDYQDKRFLPYMISANVEKITAQRNHPAIIIWSLGNESRWSPLWNRVNQVVKALDPTRPTTFHDQCWGGFNNAKSQADIAVYHYPGINGGKACDTMKRPVLFGEYAHISCYNRRELVTDPGIRSAYGPALVTLYDSMYQHPACLGGAIWSGIDDIFHLPGGQVVGYGPWGVIDAWRRPKPEFYGMKKAYAPVVIKRVVYPADGTHTLRLLVENRYDFTNLESVAITCRQMATTTRLQANIAPHDSGWIAIPVTAATTEVGLDFTDPRGFCVDSALVVLQPKQIAPRDKRHLAISENDATVTVHQGAAAIKISKLTGTIVEASKAGRLLLERGPVFAVVPENAEDGGKVNVAGETYQNEIYPLQAYTLYPIFAKSFAVHQTDSIIAVSMEVHYSDGSRCEQTYRFDALGKLTVAYTLHYKGTDTLPRQYGMLLQLPVTFQRLEWQRHGAFSVYPADDIARTAGSAVAGPVRQNDVEPWGVVPAGAWKEDANALGTNDFRSTKANIYSASLLNEQGDRVTILSDGTQSARSWLQSGQVQWLAADYSNNGSEPFYGRPFSDGKINIKDKTLSGILVLALD
ncbi:glycoside hydrolase family 2 TIM barrel-domain containing protein [Deminuibacter soli]|uniref:beta-galactosidase n=1 Tax=Deminuibacter soli TaxID=2291815 RepID=A0A3E1NFZ1_9BACT|nr:glycoside hydrolase family 2 TIM barrel-domain containing protein [Deminuibacter soli]RFM26886.1 beta-galactosidase [Deminuibacter soli]